jgi:hypothetical protein
MDTTLQVVVDVVGAVVVGVVDVVSGWCCCGCYNSKGVIYSIN